MLTWKAMEEEKELNGATEAGAHVEPFNYIDSDVSGFQRKQLTEGNI